MFDAKTESASAPRLITVGGGRGGLGKSLVAAQLAWAFAAGGRRVVLVDLDLAAASQHLLFGLRGAAPGLAALLSSEGAGKDALCATRHPNLRLVTGGRGSLRPEALTAGARLRLLQRLSALDADVVVMDVGAGIGYDPVDLLELGHQRLLVATGQATSVHAAFALLKAAVTRTVRRQLAPVGQLGLLEPAYRTREGERLAEVVRRIRATDPALASSVADSLTHFGAFLFGNQMTDATHLGALQAMVKMSADYLGTSPSLLGWMRAQARLPELSSARPSMPASEESLLFEQLAAALIAGPVASISDLLDELAAGAAPPPIPALPPPPRASTLPTPAAVATTSVAPASPPASGRRPPARPPALPVRPPAAPAPAARLSAAHPTAAHAPPPAHPDPAARPSSRLKPLVYVRPPRRQRSPELARKPTPLAIDLRRRRPVALPGMPPGRARK